MMSRCGSGETSGPQRPVRSAADSALERDISVEATAVAILPSAKRKVTSATRVVQDEASLVDQLYSKYATLRSEIRAFFPPTQLKVSHNYVLGYPDPLLAADGTPYPVVISDSSASIGFAARSLIGGAAVGSHRFEDAHGEGEITWAQKSIFEPSTQIPKRAANLCTYIPPLASFAGNGSCSPTTCSPSSSRCFPRVAKRLRRKRRASEGIRCRIATQDFSPSSALVT